VYDALAREPTAVVVEMPFFPPRAFSLSAPYMLNSTRHWRPILNGYSGFRPGSYDRAYEAVQGFPNPASLIAMHGLGVTHVVVHMGEFCVAAGPECPETVARSASLEPVAESGDIHIYRLR
jgi:hypothetical protein